MAIVNEDSTGSLIESAMGRLGGAWRSTESDGQCRDDKRALQQRLEQLRAAMGDDEARPGVESETTTPLPVPTVSSRSGYRPTTLLLVAAVSALIGSGATRWTMTSDTAADRPVERVELPSSPAAALPEIPTATPEREVRELVERWRQAWAGKDIDTYLACYGADFVPANGSTRSQWEIARRKAILGKTSITVQINDLKIGPAEGDRREVTFLQDYTAGAYHETARPKTLTLIRQGGRWTIAREAQGV